LTRSIPTFLVGLKSDLPHQVDPKLIQQTLKHFQADALSEMGVQQMQSIFKQLINMCSISGETKARIQDGFVYAPTVRKDELTPVSATSSGTEADADKGMVEKNHIVSTFSSFHPMINQRGTTHFPRRGSKDSR
jgi:hypothetical protein